MASRMRKIDKPGTFAVPRELTELLAKFGTIAEAARHSGLSKNTISLLKNGQIDRSDRLMAKIEIGLKNGNGNGRPKFGASGYTNIDPLLPALMAKFNDDREAASKAIGTSRSNLNNMLRGGTALAKQNKIRIERLLGAAPLDSTPTLTIGGLSRFANFKRSSAAKKSKFDKTDPPLIRELIAKFGGARDRAGKAIGYSGAQKLNDISNKKKEMDPDTEARIRAVLADQPLPKIAATDDLDRYSLNICLVICNNVTNFERVYEAGEAFDCEWLFKISKGSLWIGFLRYVSVDKIKTFKKLCGRDAVAIVCP